MAITPGVTTPAQVNPMVQMEALRRRADLGASTAAIPGGVDSNPNPQNPIAQEGVMTNPPAAPSMQGGAAGTPSDGTIAGMKQQKSEAQTLTNAMIWRQKKLTERGE